MPGRIFWISDPASVTVERVRREVTMMGVQLNLEQAVSDTVGLFARAGLADGAIEPYDFTDIDRTVAAGASMNGGAWGRGGDVVGVAAVANGISRAHRCYLAAGGLGVLVGDGRLPHSGAELIGEAYYRWHVAKPATVTLDWSETAACPILS